MSETPSRVGPLLALLALVVAGVGVWKWLDRDAPRAADADAIVGAAVQLTRVADFGTPIVDIQAAHDGSGRLFVVESDGVVRALVDGAPGDALLDLRDRVLDGGERGLLGLAFENSHSADAPYTGRLYVNYTAQPDGRTVVSRFRIPDDGTAIDPASEEVLFELHQPYSNHNGGQLQIGYDGRLWIGTGDGGSGGDPDDRAQNPDDPLGKMLRVDVIAPARGMDGAGPDPAAAYRTPDTNAFPEGSGDPRVWGTGLRNPWRFAFDRETGGLWVADVGQNEWEELNYVPRGAPAGVNFGWDVFEGDACYGGSACDGSGMWAPEYVYDHDDGCSVTGGVVVRDDRLPALDGHFLFADYCNGWIRALPAPAYSYEARADREAPWRVDDARPEAQTVFEATGLNISSFGVDEAGRVYVLDLSGVVFRLDPLDPSQVEAL